MNPNEMAFFMETVDKALNAAEVKAELLNVSVYCVVGVEINPITKEVLVRGRWLNPNAPKPNWFGECNIEGYAFGKFASTIHHDMNTPPTTILEADVNYLGGVTQDVYRVGVSGTDEKDDYEIAMVALEYMLKAVPDGPTVNHIGLRISTLQEFDNIKNILLKMGWVGYQSPAADHLDRWYFEIPGSMGVSSGLYLELQVFETSEYSAHIEVGLDNPTDILGQFGPFVPFDSVAPNGMVRVGSNFSIHSSSPENIVRTPGK